MDLQTIIEDAAQGPASARVDTTEAKQQPLPDLIAADKYLAGKEAAANTTRRGIRFVKLIPPGSV